MPPSFSIPVIALFNYQLTSIYWLINGPSKQPYKLVFLLFVYDLSSVGFKLNKFIRCYFLIYWFIVTHKLRWIIVFDFESLYSEIQRPGKMRVKLKALHPVTLFWNNKTLPHGYKIQEVFIALTGSKANAIIITVFDYRWKIESTWRKAQNGLPVLCLCTTIFCMIRTPSCFF